MMGMFILAVILIVVITVFIFAAASLSGELSRLEQDERSWENEIRGNAKGEE